MPARANVNARATADRPDEVKGYQVHVMYVVPSDGEDRRLDVTGDLVNSLAAIQNWFAAQSGGTRLRMDTANGSLDITFFRLTRADAVIAATGAFVRDQVEAELHAHGFNEPNKLYAVYYDGASTWACGGGAWPPRLIGNVAAMYLRGLPKGPVPCDRNRFAASPTDSPGYLEFAMLHEIFHTLGAAARCAPHHTLDGHVSDTSTDLMYAGAEVWRPSVLDRGHDDYWAHANPQCVDVSKSVFMEPLPANAMPPPGWR